jgi:hypothetical protein
MSEGKNSMQVVIQHVSLQAGQENMVVDFQF